MKNSFFKKTLLMLGLVASLSLNGCSNTNNGTYVINDLDLYVEKDNQDFTFSPRRIIGDDFLSKINNKESFILYFNSRYCATCKLVDEYFHTFLRNYNYLIYSFSAQASDFHYISDLYPDYFDVTPKVMFFNDGELTLTLSSSRYTSYRLFESAMVEFAHKSNMYTATSYNAISQFFSNNSNFNLIFVNPDNQYYDVYINDIYDLLISYFSPTLILDLTLLEEELVNTLYTNFNLNRRIETYFLTYTKQSITNYNYSLENDLEILINKLMVN